jgi:hypothetical protein
MASRVSVRKRVHHFRASNRLIPACCLSPPERSAWCPHCATVTVFFVTIATVTTLLLVTLLLALLVARTHSHQQARHITTARHRNTTLQPRSTAYSFPALAGGQNHVLPPSCTGQRSPSMPPGTQRLCYAASFKVGARNLWPEFRAGIVHGCFASERTAVSAFESGGIRHACTLQQQDRPPQAAPNESLGRLLQARLAYLLALAAESTRTIWFLGDSVTLAQAFLLSCRMSKLCSFGLSFHDGSTSMWHRPGWMWREDNRDTKNGRSAHCSLFLIRAARAPTQTQEANLSSTMRLCYIPAGPRASFTETVAGALERLAHLNQTSSQDIAVLNDGSWYLNQNGAADQAHLQAVREVVELFNRWRSQEQLPTLIWRETLATHFPSSQGLYKPPGWPVKENCMPLSSFSPPQVLANVSQLIIAAKLRFVHAWHKTRPLHAHHDRKAIVAKSLDCLHYCLFTGGSDGVLEETVKEIVRAWSTSSKRAETVMPAEQLHLLPSVQCQRVSYRLPR